jgi:hypothetical protein
MTNELKLEEVASALADKGLQNPALPFLGVDPSYIRILMAQPRMLVSAEKSRVAAKDRAAMTEQMKSFLAKAKELHVDLAVCPEYSCTWDALTASIEAGVYPDTGKMWALGCESATENELHAILEQLKDKIRIVFDESVLKADGNFCDLMCYLFNTKDTTGSEVRVILLQAKTCPMGGDHFEYSYLKTGNKIYRFTNSTEPSFHLVGLICSDTLHKKFGELLPEIRNRSLILHIQLNNNPSSEQFRAYRFACCGWKPRTVEIICLNWALGTRLEYNGKNEELIKEPKTILFRDVNELAADDLRIKANHAKGCYLTNWQEQRTAAFIFSPDPYLFYFETTKPVVEAPATNANRTGPRMEEIFVWSDHTHRWEIDQVGANDRFKEYWFDAYDELKPLLAPLLPEYLNTERLIQLCTGHASGMEWIGWNRLRSFRLAGDDTTRRLTLCWSPEGLGLEYRQECLSRFRGFAGVIGQPGSFSARLVSFKMNQFTVELRADKLHNRFRNLHIAGRGAATAIYLGQTPARNLLSEVKKRTMAGLGETGSDPQLFALWYRDAAGDLRDFMDEDVPQINADPSVGPVGIDNPAP